MNVLLENDVEDGLIWNSEISSFDSFFTYTDICEIMVSVFKYIAVDNSFSQGLIN